MKVRKLELGLFFVIFIVIGLTLQTANYSPVDTVVQSSPNLERDATIAGIYITDNSGFLSAGFTGAGIEGNPYILDGVTITVPTGGVGIFIQDTTAHYIIQNCVVNLTSTTSTHGIYLYTVNNGTIADCEILGTGTGIYARGSNDIAITGSTVYDCTMTGIQAYLTSGLEIIGNTITDVVWRGIQLTNSPNTNIAYNTINRINYDSAQSNSWGIDCEASDNLTISNNEVRSTMRGQGINIETADNVVIDSNIIWQAYTGLFVYSTPAIVISNNNISCMYNFDLWMHTVVNPHVFGNSLHHTTNANGKAIHLQTCSSGVYEHNDLFKCWYGFSIDSGSGNNTIRENNIGWCDLYFGYDARTSNPKNNWTSNQFSDFVSNPYYISGVAGVNDTSASLLTDSTGPTIDLLSDIVIKDTDTDKWVTWHPDDRFPSTYTIRINGSLEVATDWCNSSISYSLDNLVPGIHDFQVIVYDCGGNPGAQDDVRITVLDASPPVFTSATSDYTIEAGERAWTNFTATDFAPSLKMCWVDDQGPYWNNAWTSPLVLNWDHVFPSVGVHNYTVMLTDKAGNFATRTCIVTVEDTTSPTVSSNFPTDFSSETGVAAWVNFTLNDFSPNIYEIWLDDSMDSTAGFTDAQFIAYMVNYTIPGEHNITLIAWDDYDNTVKKTCIITYVDSTRPSITGPDDFSYEAGESPATSWSWTELDPENYTIYENGTLDTFSTTFSGDIQHTLDGLTPGLWNITLIIYDESGNFETDELWVTVEDTTAPVLSGLIDQEISASESVLLNWTCSDLYPEWLILSRNGTVVADQIWDGSDYSYLVDNLAPGIYNFTLIVTDSSGNSASDFVLVTVTEVIVTTTTTTTTTTTSTTDTTHPPPDDGGTMLILIIAGGGAIALVIVIIYLKSKK